jgi:lipopolysaccharide transport system permease protein
MNRDSIPVIRIEPVKGWFSINLRELWEFRELLYFLTWRNIKIRYKQTVLGVAWAVLQPLAMMLVFTLFFGKLARIPSEGIPYPIFAYAGLLPWQLFSRTILESTQSIVSEQRLVSKVFFPRILIPTSTCIAAMLDFGIGLVLLFILMLFYGIVPAFSVLWLPVFIVLMLATGLGVGYWLSALNVEYRDISYTVPFLNQIWMFITPVVYPSALVPENWRLLYGLNPMAGVVEGFRWCLLGVGEGLSAMFWFSVSVSLVLFISGAVWFRRRERTFVDILG